MQLSIPSFILGSPTIYKIIVTSDNGPIQIDRRYSEFLKLAEDFAVEMDEQVPVPPPAKKWIGNNNVEFCERRRKDLELMMRALIRNPEYVSSLSVQTFLQLSRKQPSANTDWLQLSARVGDLIAKAKVNSVPSQKRKLCLEAKTHLTHLQKQLSETEGIGAGEKSRRTAMLEEYQHSINQIESQASKYMDSQENAQQLFSTPRQSARILGETDKTRRFNNSELYGNQNKTMEEQDAQIEQLRAAIGRQQSLGLAINDELTSQNELLEQLDSQVHHVNTRVNQAKRATQKLN